MSIEITMRVVLLGGLAALIFIALAMGQNTYERPHVSRPQHRNDESQDA